MEYLTLFQTHQNYEAFVSGGTMVRPNISRCINENEVHYNPPIDPFNGYAYIDLGLPSGTKWATMNVGANSPTDYGLYFAWGETQGYTASQVGTDKNFSWSDYALTEDSGSTFTKYNATDGLTLLEPTDDAASVNMGGDWHMPTKVQYQELCNTAYATNAWITNYQGSGINGRLFTSVSNGNTVFIPAAGYCGDGKVISVENSGYVWTSSLLTQNITYAWGFGFYSVGAGVDYTFGRYNGLSVRGVIG